MSGDLIEMRDSLTSPEPERRMTGTCVVTPETLGPFTNGGVGTAAYRLAQLLAQRGHEVTLVYSGKVVHKDRSQWQERYYGSRRINLVVIEDLEGIGEPGDVDEPYPSDLDTLRAVRVHEFLRRQAFEVVYFQEFMGHGLRAIQACRAGLEFSGTHIVTWCHSSQLWSMHGNDRHVTSRNEMMVEAHERIATQSCELVAAPSRYMADWVRSKWGIQEVKMLPYWYSRAERVQGGGGVLRHEGFSRLVFFGRLERRKGLDLLLGALRSSARLRAAVERVSFLGRQISIDGCPSGEYIGNALAGLALDWEVVDGLGTDDALAWLARQEGALVVAPSVLDNFPFVIMELLEMRLPFVSTAVGGIPEVVGETNATTLLAEPTVAGIRGKLEEVFEQQFLLIDYDACYSPELVEERVVAFHRELLADRRAALTQASSTTQPSEVDVWIMAGGGEADVKASFASIASQASLLVRSLDVMLEPDTTDFMSRSLSAWATASVARGECRAARVRNIDGDVLSSPGGQPILLMRAGETLLPDAARRLLRSLQVSDCGAMCGYVRRPCRSGDSTRWFEHRPLGGALELGLMEEISMTTPMVVQPCHGSLLARWLRGEQGRIHGALQGFSLELNETPERACHRLGILPERVAEGPALQPMGQRERSRQTRLGRRFQAQINSELLVPLAFAGLGPSRWSPHATSYSASSGAYKYLAEAAEDKLAGFLQRSPRDDAITLISTRIGPLLPEWTSHPPPLFVFGAGEHSKVMLGLFPILWSWIISFLDSRRTEPFLGRPCRHPRQVAFPLGAVVIYSSREHEDAMYRTLSGQAVTHIRIYGHS